MIRRLKERLRVACGSLSKIKSEDSLEQPVVTTILSKTGDAETITLGAAPVSAEGKTFRSEEVLAGRWKIMGLLGKGGMGEVYLAFDKELREHVALKTLHGRSAQTEKALDRFRAEIRLARKIGHPNICKVYDLFTHRTAEGEEIPFVTMELLSGETLAARLKRGPLERGEALLVARQIIEGLAAAHDKGILHQDLKCSNIMLVATPGAAERVAIMDFGLAGVVSTDSTFEPESTAGTPGYMAPEQWEGTSLSFATDIYALGVVLYEMVTGKKPFGDKVTTGMLLRQQKGEILDSAALRGEVDSNWERAIVRCLEPDPARRFQNAREVLAAFDPFTTPFWRRPQSWAVAAAVLLIAIPLSLWSPLRNARNRARSVMVIPFASAGPADGAFYASGLSDELIGSLTRVPGVRVMARETAAQSTARSDPAAAARELGAGRFVRGSVEVSGSEVNISAQLVEVSDNRILWTQRFHRPNSEAFELFHEVGAAVVTAILPVNEEVRRKTAHQPDPEAYRLYLDGRYLFNYSALDPRNGEKAAQLFEQAIAKDPNFSDAYTGLVDAYFVTGGPPGWSSDHLNDVLRQSAARALSLDPTSPEALGANATLLQHVDYNWALAEQYLRRAVQIQPGNATIHAKYGGLLSDMGRVNEAMREFDTALDLDPLSPSLRNTKAICLYLGRRYSDAKKLVESMLEGTQGYHLFPYLGAIYLTEGKTEQGLAQYRLGVEKAHQDPQALAHLAYALAKIGQTVEARRVLSEITPPHDAPEPFYTALVYSALHENDAAFHWLDQAFATHDWSVTLLKVHPYLDDLRRDPRFPACLRRLNLN